MKFALIPLVTGLFALSVYSSTIQERSIVLESDDSSLVDIVGNTFQNIVWENVQITNFSTNILTNISNVDVVVQEQLTIQPFFLTLSAETETQRADVRITVGSTLELGVNITQILPILPLV